MRGNRQSFFRNPHRREADRRSRPQLPPPAPQLARMDPGFAGNRRDACSRLQRRRHQALLLRRVPVPPTLDRRDDLDPPVRHVSTPVNTHVTHSLIYPARRPLPEGYGEEEDARIEVGSKEDYSMSPPARITFADMRVRGQKRHRFSAPTP